MLISRKPTENVVAFNCRSHKNMSSFDQRKCFFLMRQFVASLINALTSLPCLALHVNSI